MNYDRVLQLFRSRFANARGFEFYFVGNVDEATLRPLVEQYIASLPAQKVYTDKAHTNRVPQERLGTNKKEYSAAMETPMGYRHRRHLSSHDLQPAGRSDERCA